VRQLSLSFDFRDIDISAFAAKVVRERKTPNQSKAHAPTAPHLPPSRLNLKEKVHFYASQELMSRWFYMVWDVAARSRLESLQVDSENCYCPLDCCQLCGDGKRPLSPSRHWPANSSAYSKLWAHRPKILKICGWHDETQSHGLKEDLEGHFDVVKFV